MKTPILHVPRLADQEIVLRMLYGAGYAYKAYLDVNDGWQHYMDEYAGSGIELSYTPYMYVEHDKIRGTSWSELSWQKIGGPGVGWNHWIKVNSVGQMIRYLKRNTL